MSGSPAWPLQQAVYTRLSGDATLVTTLGAAVYSEVPDGAAFPYVHIGDDTEVPNSTMGRSGRDTTLTIHTWARTTSTYSRSKRTKEIQDRVDELLDRWTPTVTGWESTAMLLDARESFTDPDGITRHGVQRYRIHNHE